MIGQGRAEPDAERQNRHPHSRHQKQGNRFKAAAWSEIRAEQPTRARLGAVLHHPVVVFFASPSSFQFWAII